MCQDELKFVEEFIENSPVLRKIMAPLPYESYHITTYNIYAHNQPPIKFVRDWLDANKMQVISHDGCIPPKDVCPIMIKAQQVWDETCTREFTIRPNGVKVLGSSVLIIEVSIPDEQLGEKFKQARLQCDQIFDKQDLNLPLHITLGYLFASPKYLGRDEMANFNEAVAQLGKFVPQMITMKPPAVSLFASMKQFIPFRNFFEEGKWKY